MPINLINNIDPRLKKGIIYLTIAIFLILLLPYFLTRPNFLGFDFSETGPIGDTIGGIIGPFIAIIAAVLTFLAFWVQYQANEQLRKDIRIDRLENRILEMINLHKQNLNELSITNYSGKTKSGRSIFPYMFYEFKRIYLTLYKNEKSENDNFTVRKKQLDISYTIFFIGICNEMKEHLIGKLKKNLDDEEITAVIELLEQIQSGDFTHAMDLPGYDFYKEKFEYQQINGYANSLGNYYRHLFQMVKYIDEYPADILSNTEKYNYVKTIRAQLSDYEQLLLFYSALSSYGEAWLKNGYLIKYKLIKNMPFPLADFGITPKEIFNKELAEAETKGEEFFEWNK